MKKKVIIIVCILVVLLICLGSLLINCKISKDKMIDMAKELEMQEFNKEVIENIERAKDKYIKNIYEITGFVTDISDNTIVVEENNSKMVVCIKKEDIKKIDKNQKITLVGKIEDIKVEEKSGDKYKITKAVATMKNAYITKDTFEISGTVVIPEKEHYIWDSVSKKSTTISMKEEDWYCNVDGKYNLTEFAETKKFADEGESIIAGATLNNKQIIIFSGKIIRNIKRNSAGVETVYDVKELKIIKSEE